LDKVAAELAIRNVIGLYGLAADCGDIETALACHTVDAVYVVSDPLAGREGRSEDLELKGHDAIREMLSSPMHEALLPNCAHTVGPLVVKVFTGTATVLGYSRVYYKNEEVPILMRVAFNRWHMMIEKGKWKIARRESRVMGEDKAQSMLKETIKGML